MNECVRVQVCVFVRVCKCVRHCQNSVFPTVIKKSLFGSAALPSDAMKRWSGMGSQRVPQDTQRKQSGGLHVNIETGMVSERHQRSTQNNSANSFIMCNNVVLNIKLLHCSLKPVWRKGVRAI